MKIEETVISGCYIIKPEVLKDNRGTFVKTLHEEIYKKHGLQSDFAEEYFSESTKGVLRGLHFHLPPHDHVKMVYCVKGNIFDAIVDLRNGSPTFGKYTTFELDSQSVSILYLDKGIAHGFYVLSNSAIVIYKVSSVYAPEYDYGILWNSVEIPWPNTNPVLSERDKQLPAMQDFSSPFHYKTNE